MNYRHAFHAGNFADVLKHAVLARILVYMTRKETALRYIDTHAGAGLYRLDAEEAKRTGEWQEGVGRLLGPLEPDLAGPLAPWLDLARPLVENGLYPGSPRLAQALTRPQDRLVLCEKHPEDAKSLDEACGRDRRTRIIAGDGWAALKGLLPPPERRGLVLVDPPFEEARELAAIEAALAEGLRRFAGGTFLVWYPIKGRREVEQFSRKIAALPAARILRAEIGRFRTERIDRLNGCGLMIINPNYGLDQEIRTIAGKLAPILAREGDGNNRVEWLKSE
jgi:23S rRNA (adenine2030-N6)-methyltransferase